MTRQQTLFLILAGLGLLIATDRMFFRPIQAEEMRLEEKQDADCWSTLAQIRTEGGDAAKEQINGKLAGCEFGTTLG